MTGFDRFAVSALTAAGLLLLAAGGGAEELSRLWRESTEQGRMKNVVLLAEKPPAGAEPAETPRREPAAQTLSHAVLPPMESFPEEAPAESVAHTEQVLETTIQGGMRIKNETGYFVDAGSLLAEGPALRLPRDEAQILIIHTHASEAYTQAGLDRYTPSDLNRTEDTQFNIVRVGDELTELLTRAGLGVIHDRGIYDYPSYTGSYARSLKGIEAYLEEYPTISIVLDVHRDAMIASDGTAYKVTDTIDGKTVAQVMLVVGTNDGGLEHPGWEKNVTLAAYIQARMLAVDSGFPRPVNLRSQRFNQHMTAGSLLVEVGTSGNTLQEALAGARLFARAAGEVYLSCMEEP